jgi:hypothetical protein
MPPRIPGGNNCYKVAVLNDEDYEHGLYERTSCGPDVWEILIPFTEGHCPYSEDDPDGEGCDPEGYEPGGTWEETTADGYDAAWEDPTAIEPPSSDGMEGEWVWAGYLEGGSMYNIWRNLDCHWIAYGLVDEVYEP